MIKEEEKKITIKGVPIKITRRIIPTQKIYNNKIETTHQDCFAYKNKVCSALNDLYCKKEECRFYKTEIQRLAELEKIKKREEEEI